jgi:hypothetical protein
MLLLGPIIFEIYIFLFLPNYKAIFTPGSGSGSSNSNECKSMRIRIRNIAFYFLYRMLKLFCFSPTVPSPSEWRGRIPRPLGQLTSWHLAKTTAKQLIQQKSARITGQNLVALAHRVTRTGSEEVSSELLLAMAN